MSYNSKYSGAQVEELLDHVANAKETDPVFAASPAASITDEQIAGWEGKQGKLTFDTEPIEGSSNPVTSDGIFKALSKIDISIFLPVATLPTEDINPNKVYLVKDAEGESGNMFAEYIYTDGAWELIGRSKINLEDYYTKSEIDALFANVKVEGVLTEEDIATVNGQKLTNGGNILISAETIVLDAEPTEGSVNGVTSGGVVDYMKPIYGEEIDINSMLVVAEKGYKWLHGTKTAASSWSIYEPISLKKGDIINWTCPEYGVYIGMDFMGYMDGETYVPLVTLTGDLSFQYILQNDYDVIFCLRPNPMMTIKVTRNGKYEGEELTGRHYYAMDLLGYTNTHITSVGGVFGWIFGGGSEYSHYRTVALKVNAGEIFVINCQGSNPARTWVFVDDNDIIVDMAPNTISAKPYEVVVPKGATWLICSQWFSRYGEGVVYKKTNYNQDDRAIPVSDRYFWSSGKAVITKAVGEVCDYALSNNWGNGYTVITVAAGDEYSITLSQNEYPGYMVLNAARVVIASENPFEHPQYISGYKITIPEGGVFLVINKTSGSAACFRKLKDGRQTVKEHNQYKEGFLANMSRHISNVNDQSTWTKRLCMAWISDTHYDAWQYERFHDYIKANKAYIDAVLHTGDANRMSDTDKGFVKTLLEHRQTIPVVYAIGNHDAHGQTNGAKQALVSGDMLYNGTNYTQHFFDSNCVSTEDKCTYYRDFSTQKIRIISINDYAFPRYVDGNGWVTTTDETDIANATEWVSGKSYAVDDVVLYKGLYVKCTTAGVLADDGTTWRAMRVPLSKYNVDCRYLTQEYVDFIINALNVDAGWSVILTAHQPFETSSNQEVANEAWQTAYQAFNVPTTKYGQNGYILQDILSAYIKRTAIEKTYSAIAPATDPTKGTLINDENIPDVTVSADFTLAKGSIIGFLNGHQHTDTCLYSAHMDEGIKLLCIGINTGCFCPIDQTERFYSGDIVKGEDGTRDLFNIISFDTESKEIFLLRIGADVTENFTERKFARIKYTT